jgi:hypothetical protein
VIIIDVKIPLQQQHNKPTVTGVLENNSLKTQLLFIDNLRFMAWLQWTEVLIAINMECSDVNRDIMYILPVGIEQLPDGFHADDEEDRMH